MNTATWSSPAAPAAALREALLPLGFTPAAGGYERDTLRVEPGPDWWCFTQLQPHAPFTDAHEQTGPWKWVEMDGARVRALVLPAAIFSEDNDAQSWDPAEPASVLQQLLIWVQATMEGEGRHDWRAPERVVVESWFRRDQLTVVVGDFICQGELICDPDRLALRFPVLTQVPPDLPASRLGWLRALLEETQNRWHLVRCGLARDADTGQVAAVVELDLTGVPAAVNETLFVTSLEALRGAVQWVGEPADWLADVTVASELLAVCPKQEPTKGTI